MIAKAVKGKGFRGALNYDLNSEKGQMLDTNMAGDNPRDLAREFGEIRKLRPNLGKAVLHVSLSAALDEHLTDDQWREIGKTYLEGMGLDNNQYLITRHTDTEHQHIHILANRIQFDGNVTSDSQDYKRQEAIMRKIEQDYRLTKVTSSRDAERRAITTGEKGLKIRTGEPPIRERLQTIIDQATADKPTFLAFASRLHHAEVSILPSGKTGTPQGISFELNGIAFKGSDLGKSYAWKQLQSRLDFNPERDQSVIDALRQRDFSYLTKPQAVEQPETPKKESTTEELIKEMEQRYGLHGLREVREQQRQVEREQIERRAREEAEKKQQAEQQTEKAEQQRQAAQEEAKAAELKTRELLDLSPDEVIKNRPELADTFKIIEKAKRSYGYTEKDVAMVKNRLAREIDAGNIPKIKAKDKTKDKDMER